MLLFVLDVWVYLNFVLFICFVLFSVDQVLWLVGVYVKCCCGEGIDFYQMCEYCVGDSLCQLDWKVIVCVCKLILCEYQDEKNQQLLLMFDSGWCMLVSEGGFLYFDYVLNVLLVVVYLVLCQGDVVGLFVVGGECCWVVLQCGMGMVEYLLCVSYDLQLCVVVIDYLVVVIEVLLCQCW